MISGVLLKQKILEFAFCGKLTKIPESVFTKKHINEVMDNYDSKRKPVSKSLRGNLDNNYDYYGATGKIDMINEYIFDGNYLLIGEDGGNFFVDRDNSFIVNGKFWANNHVHVLSSGNNITNRYIMHYLNSLNFPKMGLISGVAVPKLNQKNLNSIIVPICSIEEQDRIVKRIDKLFELIDKKEKNDQEQKKLKIVLKDKILNSAFDGNLTSSNTITWNECVFSDIIDVRDGTHDSPKYVEYSDYPLITSKNLTENGLDFSNVNYLTEKDYNEINKRSFVDDGDVLFAMIGSIGNPVIVNKDRLFAIKNVALFKCGNEIYNKYLYYYLLHEKDMSEQTKGGVQKFVSLKILRNYPIKLPPLEEQKRIVEKIESLFELIEQL